VRRGCACGRGRWAGLGVAALTALLAVLVSALFPACGYSTGIRVADRVGSVGVTVFGNVTMERDLERDFQDQIARALRSYTDAPIQDPERAEILIRGTVIAYNRRDGIRSVDNELLETGLYVEAEAGLYDRRSDRALGPQRRARVSIGYVLDEGESSAARRGAAGSGFRGGFPAACAHRRGRIPILWRGPPALPGAGSARTRR
jgi:hypothetical protein